MNYEFTNGTAQQRERWEEAVRHLLNFPPDSIGLTVVVSFVDPATLSGHGHTDLALTTYTFGSASAKTEVRSDAPGFGDQLAGLKSYAASLGLTFSTERFYMETAIHELGHALFAALPQPRRAEIAQLFGAKGSDIEELEPPGSAWQDRIIEGIAETFKEAFLPARYRVFPNRTNRKISYAQYPEFRRLFRSGVAIPGEEIDLLKGLHTDIAPSGESYWESRVPLLEQAIAVPTDFNYSFTIPRSWFPPTAVTPFTIYTQLMFALRVRDKVSGAILHFARGAWQLLDNTLEEADPLLWSDTLFQFIFNFPEPPNVPMAEDNSEGGTNHWLLYGEEAVADGAPTLMIAHAFSVAAGRTIEIEALVRVRPGPQSEEPLDPTLAAKIDAAVPSLIYRVGGSQGPPVVVPSGEAHALGARAGLVPSRGRVVGARA